MTDDRQQRARSLLIAAAEAEGDENAVQWLRDNEPGFGATALRAIAQAEADTEARTLREAADFLDGYAGGHYMAKSCATALRELADHRLSPENSHAE